MGKRNLIKKDNLSIIMNTIGYIMTGLTGALTASPIVASGASANIISNVLKMWPDDSFKKDVRLTIKEYLKEAENPDKITITKKKNQSPAIFYTAIC